MPLRYPHALLATTFLAASALLAPGMLAAQTRILVCESQSSACSRPSARLNTLWTFNGNQGTATAPDHSTSMLTLETLTADTLVVRRSYPNGLIARYTGKVSGTRILGNVQWFWPGHTDYPSNGIFTAILQSPSSAPSTPDDTP